MVAPIFYIITLEPNGEMINPYILIDFLDFSRLL